MLLGSKEIDLSDYQKELVAKLEGGKFVIRAFEDKQGKVTASWIVFRKFALDLSYYSGDRGDIRRVSVLIRKEVLVQKDFVERSLDRIVIYELNPRLCIVGDDFWLLSQNSWVGLIGREQKEKLEEAFQQMVATSWIFFQVHTLEGGGEISLFVFDSALKEKVEQFLQEEGR